MWLVYKINVQQPSCRLFLYFVQSSATIRRSNANVFDRGPPKIPPDQVHLGYPKSITRHTGPVLVDYTLALFLGVVAVGEEHALIASRFFVFAHAARLEGILLASRSETGG